MDAFQSAHGAAPAVLFTAHSLPEKVLSEGDPYDGEVHETAAAVAERCRLREWLFAYQSQGATAEPWLGPTVESALDTLAAKDSRQVLIAPIGFVADHVEILYDIDIAFQRYAQQRGITLQRMASLNDSPTLIGALATLVRRNLAIPAGAGRP
jgi:ferrochelatase